MVGQGRPSGSFFPTRLPHPLHPPGRGSGHGLLPRGRGALLSRLGRSPNVPAYTVSSPLRIAMWSGPRNVSTACMRAFDSRDDSVVCDEPLYAHYLLSKGREHPLAAEVMARHETDWRKVAAWLTGPLADGERVFYQKHMAHHLLPEIERGWLEELVNCFLIREPRHMLRSLLEKLPSPELEDTGLPQQVELFEQERARTGRLPAVVDSKDLLLDPLGVLTRLCEQVGLDFQQAMLSWEPGPRDTDGCWAPYWYENALQSTGFAPYREREVSLPRELDGLLRACEELYAHLHMHCLQPA